MTYLEGSGLLTASVTLLILPFHSVQLSNFDLSRGVTVDIILAVLSNQRRRLAGFLRLFLNLFITSPHT